VGHERFHFGSAHFGRMADIVKEDVAFDPADVGLLSANGIVFEADGVTDTSTTLRQAQDMAQCRPDRGVS